MNFCFPTTETMHQLEKHVRTLLPNTSDDSFVEHITNPSWPEVSKWVLSNAYSTTYSNYAAFKRLHFLCHSQYAIMDIANYDYVPDKAKAYTDLFWNDVKAASIDIWNSTRYLFTVYLEPSQDFTYVGQVKVPIYYISTNNNPHRFLLIPQLKGQLFLQLTPTRPSPEKRISRLNIYTADASFTTEVLQYSEATQVGLNALFGYSTAYSCITKAINLYLYYSQRQAEGSTSNSSQPRMKLAASMPMSDRHICFKLKKTPHLVASYKHSRPKEHIRKEHLRHYRTGKVITIHETVVNKGCTNYFSE